MAVPKAVSVSTSAVELVAANPSRTKVHIQDLHATVPLFVGQNNTVTAANGHRIPPVSGTPTLEYVEERTQDNDPFFYTGAIWGIAASTVDVRVWEKERIR